MLHVNRLSKGNIMNKYITKTALLHNGERYPAESTILLTYKEAKPIAAYLTLVEVATPDEPDTAITELGKSETVPDSSEPETVVNDAANSEIVNEEIISDLESMPEPDQPQDQDQKAEVVKPKRKAASAK